MNKPDIHLSPYGIEITDINLDEGQRSKSAEHEERFTASSDDEKKNEK